MQTIVILLNSIPERVMIAKKRLKLNNEHMAILLEMSRTNYSNIENGRRGIGLKHVLLIHEFFGVSLDWLMKGEGSIPNPTLNSEALKKLNLQIVDSQLDTSI